jgi:hypothetical protein
VFGSPEDTGITILGASSGGDIDSILMSELYEFILISCPPPDTNIVANFAHLWPYKLHHSCILAEHGYPADAQRVLEAVLACMKSSKTSSKLSEHAAMLSDRIGGEATSSSSWFGSKLPKKIWVQSFNKFVAGEEDQPTEPTTEEGGIFKRLASTPAASVTGDEANVAYFNQPHQQSLNRVTSFQAMGQDPRLNEPLSRAHSYSNMPAHAGHSQGSMPYSNMTQPHSAGQPYAHERGSATGVISPRASIDSSRPMSPSVASSSRRASSAMGDEPVNPYAPGTQLSRPGSSQSKPARAFTPEGHRRASSDHGSPEIRVPVNPYAPGAQVQEALSPRQSSNPYAPGVAQQANRYVPAKHDTGEEKKTSTESATSYEYNPYGAIYGGQLVNGHNQREEKVEELGTKEEQPESQTDDSGQGHAVLYGYEPPSYGYQPEGYDTEVVDTAASYPSEGQLNNSESGDFFVPSPAAPSFGASSYTTAVIPEENEEEEVEDLGFGNSKKANHEPNEAEEKPAEKQPEKSDEKVGKKGWFGWLRKSDEGMPKPIRAKLGEESSFYYDQELKRWVNKKSPADAAKTASLGPPPKTSSSRTTTPTPKTVSDTSSPLATPPKTGDRSASAPIQGGPTPPVVNAPSQSTSDLRKSTLTGGGLDDLLAAAPTGRKSTKRNARSRYVDIMNQK